MFEANIEYFKSHRKNSFEVFGLDVMVDESFNTWLLEINRGPYLEKSPLTKNLQGRPADLTYHVVEDMLKVLIDWEEDNSADTGGFKLIPER